MGQGRDRLTRKNRPWGRIVICILFLVLSLAALLFLQHIRGMLPSERAAHRWGGDAGRFAQVTAFFPEHAGLDQGMAGGIPSAIRGQISEQGLDPSLPENSPAYAYAASSQLLQVSSANRGPARVFATGVGGNFFLFQSVQLISGAYLPAESVNRDLVLIDETLAWILFGATDVAGMEVIIYDIPYIITGVFRPAADFANRAAYGDRPQMFLYYDALARILGPKPITMVQAALPNPLTGLGAEMFKEALDSALSDDSNFHFVENTARYSAASLIRVIQDFGTRSMVETGLRLPFWENAARMAEDFAALTLLLLVLFLLYPISQGIVLIRVLWKRRRWRFRDVRDKLEDKREERREEKWRSTQGEAEEELEHRFDVDEIIRSVRESEDYYETDES